MSALRKGSSGGNLYMKREITLFSAVSLIVGSIIGSGIFVSPGGVLLYAGSGTNALIIWAVSGIICTIGALCLSELGTLLTASGGDYIYILEAFGDFPAFVALWVNVVLIRPAVQAIMALAFADYSLALVFNGCETPQVAVKLLAACALCFLAYINCLSVRLAMLLQNVFTWAKLSCLAIIIFAGAFKVAKGGGTYVNESINSKTSFGNIALALYSGLFSYGGWNYVNFVTEELKDPQKNLPRSIWIALPLVTIVYVVVNVSYLVVLSPQEIVTSDAVAVLFGQRALGPLQYSIPLFVALSTFGSLNGTLFTSGRLCMAGARQGHLPQVLAFISIKNQTPLPAILLSSFLSILMLECEIFWLINCLSFALWLTIAVVTAALLWLRQTRPHAHRPVKVPIELAIGFQVVCIFLVVVPIIIEPQSTGFGLLFTLSAIPLYAIFIAPKRKLQFLIDIVSRLETMLQKVFGIVKADVSSEENSLMCSE